MITVSSAIRKIRRSLNEYSPFGEAVSADSDIENTAASRFSDEELQNRLLDAARYTAVLLEAEAFEEESISAINATDGGKLLPSGGDANWPLLKLIGDRVLSGSTIVTRRTYVSHLSASSLPVTGSRPIYIFEDAEFSVDNGTMYSSSGATLSGLTAAFVDVPMFDSGASYDGVSWSGVTSIPIPDTLEDALVDYVVSSCMASLGNLQLASSYRESFQKRLDPITTPRSSG